jgi:hypothetical protein
MEDTRMSGQCHSCGAPVLFVASAKSGRPMILDATPQKRIVLIDVETGIPCATLPQPRPSSAVRAHVVDTLVDHHATCPAAEQWKGRRR